MPTVRFIGRTFPAAVHVGIPLPTVHWEDPETRLIMEFDAVAKDGAITIDCRVNKFIQEEHLIPIYNRAFDIATAGLDLISFSTGRPFTVVLESFVDPTGQQRTFGHFESDLGNLVKSVRPGKDFKDVFSIVVLEWPLFVALRDLVEAISLPHRGAANCARVVETLRRQMVGSDPSNRSRGWEELRESLQNSREYLEFITDKSKGPRHGDH